MVELPGIFADLLKLQLPPDVRVMQPRLSAFRAQVVLISTTLRKEFNTFPDGTLLQINAPFFVDPPGTIVINLFDGTQQFCIQQPSMLRSDVCIIRHG
jgi:hypothetical protein